MDILKKFWWYYLPLSLIVIFILLVVGAAGNNSIKTKEVVVEVEKIATTTVIEYVNTCHKQVEYREIVVFDKIEECEKEGGTFLLFKDLSDQYVYYCDVDKELFRGQVSVKDLR